MEKTQPFTNVEGQVDPNPVTAWNSLALDMQEQLTPVPLDWEEETRS